MADYCDDHMDSIVLYCNSLLFACWIEIDSVIIWGGNINCFGLRWVLITCALIMCICVRCSKASEEKQVTKAPVEMCYCAEDFEGIIIGQSTFCDVYKIAPTESIQATSYGGFCEYPTLDGGCIRIKFYGKEMIVGDLEVEP